MGHFLRHGYGAGRRLRIAGFYLMARMQVGLSSRSGGKARACWKRRQMCLFGKVEQAGKEVIFCRFARLEPMAA